MELSPVFLKQFCNVADRILHVPGNYTGDKILEMTVVVDTALDRDTIENLLPQLLRRLKMHDKVYQNVRLNVAYWNSDGSLTNRVCPMMQAMLSSFYEDYRPQSGIKSFEALIEALRLFHARSKQIILLTDGGYQVEDMEQLRQKMQPFLEKKLMAVVCKGTEESVEVTVSYRDWKNV